MFQHDTLDFYNYINKNRGGFMKQKEVVSGEQKQKQTKREWKKPILNKKNIKETLALSGGGSEAQGRPFS